MISVLRLDHRIERDKRITTHLALVARAFGADELIYTGDKDGNFEKRVEEINSEWGSSFSVRYASSWKKIVKEFKAKGKVVHLTMYGERHIDKMNSLKSLGADLLIVVGGPKVPGELYDLADYNIAIGNQPHSEVGALSIFLYELLGNDFLYREFDNAKSRVVPQEKGKKVVPVRKK